MAPLALINLVPLAHLVDGGPLNSDLWDPVASSPDLNVAPPADMWPADSSTDDLFPWSGSSDPTPEYDNDIFLAANPSCHADADLTQFEPYSKLRAREACPVDKPNPPLALPTLDNLGNLEGGSVDVEDLNKLFQIIPAPQTANPDNEDEDLTCPADKTYSSKTPVCDSGRLSDSHKLEGFPYSTLYNVQLC